MSAVSLEIFENSCKILSKSLNLIGYQGDRNDNLNRYSKMFQETMRD